MEINNEVIGRVVAMNVHAVVEDMLKNVGKGVKHVGNHMADRIDELVKLDLKRTAEQDAELTRLNHWLTVSSRVIDSVTTGIQVNDIGYGRVKIADDNFGEYEVESLKALTLNTPEMQKVAELVERFKRDGSESLMDQLREALSGNPWEASTNGN